MFEVLEGQNIRLRKAREDDYQSMLKHVWGDEAVYRWMLYQPTLTEEAALDRCRRSMDFQKEHYAWFVALKETDEAIGLCAIRENEPGHFEESGICIGTAFQGQGYGKEIVALLLDLVFTHLGAEDCRYGYFHDNEKSRKVAEYFGFRYEKTYELTRPWDGSLKTIDSCILTRNEYRENKWKEWIRAVLSFRKFTDFDRGIMYDILKDAYSFDERCAQCWDGNWRETDDFFFDHPEIAEKYGFITCFRGMPIGFICWDPRNRPEYVEIGHNAVRTAYKGNGFGKAQLTEALRRIKEYEGLKEIRVRTNSNLIAPRNYESVGFVLYDRKENPDETAFTGDDLYYSINLSKEE